MQWNDENSGGSHSASFYRPVVPTGYYSVGDYAQKGYAPPNGKVLLIKPLEDGVLASPVDYKWIWNDTGSGAKRECSFWRPIPPEGYRALGVLCQSERDKVGKPPLDAIMCVREDLLLPGKAGDMIWNDSLTGAKREFSSWAIIGTSQDAISCGTFLGIKGYRRQSKSPLFFCLNPALTEVETPQ